MINIVMLFILKYNNLFDVYLNLFILLIKCILLYCYFKILICQILTHNG